MTDELAAYLAVAILVGLTGFQLLLAAGVPWGERAWGGRYAVLPRGLRIASVVASLIYALAAVVILEAAKVLDVVASDALPRTAVWFLAGFFALGVVMNAISRSPKERVMAIVALSLSALCLVVAL